MSESLLLIAKNWPEPNSTAAGRRTLDLIKLFSEQGYAIHIASVAEPTPFQADLHALNITTHSIAVNDSKFDSWVSELKPVIVIYDRYIMEEQFGWRIKNALPGALTILDTSDLHCLRLAREQAIKKQQPVDLFNDAGIREITSIARCDLTIMISQIEMDILQQQFNINERHLAYLPFLVENHSYQPGPSFADRQNLIMIGGFKHEPNRDATRWLKETIWPKLKKKLPKGCEVHIYGGYADHAMNQLHSPKNGFHIKGRANDALETIGQYKINLAPLRFGAGQKGKILEGWLTGTPTITTPVGAESMAKDSELGYAAKADAEHFATTAANAYLNEQHWHQLQQNGYEILENHFQKVPTALTG